MHVKVYQHCVNHGINIHFLHDVLTTVFQFKTMQCVLLSTVISNDLNFSDEIIK